MKLRICVVLLLLAACGCGREAGAPAPVVRADRRAAAAPEPHAPDRAALPVLRAEQAARAAAPVLVPQLGHAGGAGTVAFHPGGKLLASGSGDGTVVVWEVSSGAEVRSLVGHQGAIAAVAFSRDGRQLASGSSDATVMLWEPQSGRRLRTLTRPIPNVEEVLFHYLVTSLAFSPDGKLLASGYGDGLIAIWETATGRLLRQWGSGDSPWGTWVSLSPDGRLLAATYTATEPRHSTNFQHHVGLWEVSTGALVRTITLAPNADVAGCAFSPDSKSVAAGGEVHDVATGRQVCQLTGYGIQAKSFSPNGSLVAGSSFEPQVTHRVGRGPDHFRTALWEARTGRLVRKLPGETQFRAHAAFSPDGALVAAGVGTQDVGLWETRTGNARRILAGRALPTKDLAWSPTGSPLAVLTADGSLVFSDLRTGLTGSPGDRPDKITAIAFSPNGQFIALVAGNHAELRETKTRQLVRTLSGHTHPVASLAFSHDGRLLASGSWDTTVRLWEVSTGRLLQELRGGGPAPTPLGASDAWGPRFAAARLASGGDGTVAAGIVSLAFSADDRTLATAAIHYAALWEVGTGRKLRVFDSGFGTYSVAFSPDGKLLASASWNGVIKLWKADSGRQVAESHGQQFDVSELAFTPDSRVLASYGTGLAVKLWRIPGAKPAGTLAGGPGLAFSPSGRLLATGHPGGAIALWETATRRPLVTLHLFDDGREWIAVDGEGHYDCSAGAAPILGWRVGEAVFTSADLNARLRRPGLLAGAARRWSG